MVSRLDVRVTRVGSESHAEGEYELLLLVDGRDVFDDIWGGMGRDPDTLIGAVSPLVPTDEPREVILRRCGCTVEGCNALHGRVWRDGDEIVWDEFKDYSAEVFHHRVDLPPIRFDAQQYLAEVERADQER